MRRIPENREIGVENQAPVRVSSGEGSSSSQKGLRYKEGMFRGNSGDDYRFPAGIDGLHCVRILSPFSSSTLNDLCFLGTRGWYFLHCIKVLSNMIAFYQMENFVEKGYSLRMYFPFEIFLY